jgi:hypothetical protein
VDGIIKTAAPYALLSAVVIIIFILGLSFLPFAGARGLKSEESTRVLQFLAADGT